MKKIILLITFICICTMNVFSQTTLFSEDFNAGTSTQITMNTSDQGSVTNGNHLFYINNGYAGATANADVPCLGSTFNISISSVTTPNQPSGISGYPNSNYMHINAQCANAAGITNTYFIYSSSTCFGPESYFAKMTNDISTIGMTGISLSFWWMMGGFSNAIYGEVYYSTNGGSTWTVLSNPGQLVNQQTWTQATVTNTAFDNQATLRFGWRWYCGNTSGTPTDPAMAIDDIKITAPSTSSINTQNPVPPTVCQGSAFDVPFTGTGTFNTGNVFTCELSDASGSFASPTAIGTLASTASSGIVNCVAPGSATVGTGYKVRVTSSNPPVTGIECPGNLTIQLPPTASFSVSGAGNSITVNNTSTNAVGYSWTFGDGGTSNNQSPTYTYTSAGTYTICLTATNADGCSDSSCTTYTVVGVNDLINEYSFNVFPNPASDEIFLVLPMKCECSVILFDESGKEIFTHQNFNGQAGANKLLLPYLADGIFHLQISNGKFCAGKNIMIVNGK